MNVGNIFYWVTDKAKGHETRAKYHLYICEGDWEEDNTFLFISKADYGGDYKIKKADYPFFELAESFVSCGSIVTYSDDRLKEFDQKPLGTLSKKHLGELYQAVLNSDTMEGRHIKRVCNALKTAI
jgi:hypothetical protein